MILDGHCHVWENWPYRPPVPDIASRGRAEQLLYEMDVHGVDQAVVICARLGDNAGNIDYAIDAAGRHPGRLIVFPDLESKWLPDYQTPGARARLEAALSRWSFQGFTTYLTEEEDGSWLTGDEGRAFFALAAERKLIASLSIMPHQAPAVIALAELFPTLPILLHHFAFVGPRSAKTPNGLDLVLVQLDTAREHTAHAIGRRALRQGALQERAPHVGEQRRFHQPGAGKANGVGQRLVPADI